MRLCCAFGSAVGEKRRKLKKKLEQGSGGGVVGLNLKSKAGWQVTGLALGPAFVFITTGWSLVYLLPFLDRPSTVRSGELPAWFFFWFSGCWRALAKGTAWAGFYCAILLLPSFSCLSFLFF